MVPACNRTNGLVMPATLKWTVANMAIRFPAASGSDAIAAIAAIREKE
jgi:hypothetical protein